MGDFPFEFDRSTKGGLDKSSPYII